MKKKITLLVVMVFMTFFKGQAQTQFWSDTFESGPSSGTRTPEENGGTTSPSASYFKLTNGSDILQVVPFTGKEGSSFWAGEDHNALGTGFTASGAVTNQTANATTNELHIEWTGINISGKSGMSFKGLIAAASTNEPWDNQNACISGVGTTNTDYIIVEYQIDGGAYTPLIRFYNRGSASGTSDKYLYEDTDGNGCGDGTMLTNAFAEFTKTITGTGTTLNLRIRVFSEGNNEEWGIDNFRLFETPTCTAPVITGNPPNRTVCAGNNTSFSVTATGTTGYQWQVNAGSGFTNLSNGAPYSNVTTNTLTITGVTAGMSGYLYRCVPYNVTASCFTNSNSGTLTVSSISSTGSKTDVSCFGGANGTATVAPTGGTAPYNYSWAPSGGTAATATGLAAGTYTVTVTDNNACQTTRSFTINQPTAALSAATGGGKTDVSCFGGSNGTATVAPTGGTAPYTYSWAPSGGTAATATGLAAGTYTVTVTDNNACQTTRSFTINQPTALTATTSKTDVSCNGGTNGTATISVTGGTPTYTYSWAPSGGTAATATGLAAGTYTVTVTDNNACQTTRSFTINQPTAALSAATGGGKTDVSCFGGSNGTATVAPTGGTAPYTYSWAPSGGTAATATGLAAGTYTVTVTDNNACQTTRSFTINQPTAALSAATGGGKTDVSCFGGSNGTATVAPTGGTAPYTYSWAPSGGTAATATGLAAGTYTVTVTDNNACQTTRSFTINQPTALTATTSKTDVSCNGGTNGTATVSVTGGTPTYTYSWAPSGGTAATATGLAAGTYTVTVTDNNACQTTRSFTINQPTAALSAATGGGKTDVSCFGGSNGTATVAPTGGTAPYTYSWAPSGGTAATATGLAAGTYTVTVTDNNACQTTRSFTINQPTAALSAATGGGKTDVSCFGGSNGTATVAPTGGTAPYTYSWAPSGGTAATATGLAAGTYTVTVTDNNACQTTRSFTINQPTAALSAATGGGKTDVSCNGGTNGTATVSVTGGTPTYTYSWAPSGGTAATATGLAAGTYTVTVTDNNACQTTRSFTINQPTAALSAATGGGKTDVSCFGGSNGTATVAPTGGTAPYTYSWAPSGGTAATATGLAAGTYTVTVTDNNACQTTRSFTINQPTALTATTSKTDVSCNGGTNGTATVSVTGGTPTYTYSWAPSGGTAATATGLAAGTYTVTVTDNNACQTTRSFTINQPTAALSAATGGGKTDVSCFGGSNGTATVAPTGGTAPYTYSWAPSGGTAATATGLAAGTYTVTVTDNNACQTTRFFTINQPTALTATTSKTDVSCNGGTNGTATVSVTGGTPTYTYSWAPSGGTAATATGLAAGTYTCTITDANSCQITRLVTITEPATIDNTVSVSGATVTAIQNGAVYQWIDCDNGNAIIPGATNQSFTPTISGNYAVIITISTCSATSICTNVLDAISFEPNISLLIYPNPAKGIVTVKTNFDGRFQIVNQLGQIIKNFDTTSGGEKTIDLENAAEGIYYLIGQSNEGKTIQKKIILDR